jgi:hypothetical protein
MTIGPTMKKRQDNSERDGGFNNNILELFEQSGKLRQSKKLRCWQF